MTLDVAWIDSQITRLQKLREIATDPEMMKLVALAELEVPPPPKAVSTDGPAATLSRASEVPPAKSQRGDLTKAVRDAAMRQTDWFSGYDLTKEMQQAGFPFASTRPSISVIDILRKLAAKDLLEVQEGAGNQPNKFRPKQT